MKLGAVFSDPVVGEFIVEFGGQSENLTCPDGSPYVAKLSMPKFQWERMGSPNKVFCAVRNVDGDYVPSEDVWCEPEGR